MIRHEIDRQTVARPGHVAFAVLSEGQLPGRYFVCSGARRVDDPNVGRMFEVQVTAGIGSINGARDYAHVTLALRTGLR